MNQSNFGTPVNVTATATIKKVEGRLLGFYVNSTNAGTLVLDDGSAAISGTITPAIGWHAFPASYATDLGATIAGTALDVTFFIS